MGGYVSKEPTGARGISKKGGQDLEFVKNKKLSWGDQMSVLVSTLVDNECEELILWIIDVSYFPSSR
jgi:hypothetical protein